MVKLPSRRAVSRRMDLTKKRRHSKTMLARMEVAEELLRAMVPTSTILKRLAKEWNVKPKTVEKVITEVHERWAREAEDPEFREKRRNILRQSFQQNYVLARAQGDLNQANRALIQLGKLDGCYPDDKLRVEAQVAMAGVGINLSAMGFNSPEDVRGRIAELEERMAAGGVEAIIAGIANSQLLGQHAPDENPGVTLPFLDVDPAEEEEPKPNGANGSGNGVSVWKEDGSGKDESA